jgi:hypothetical protein
MEPAFHSERLSKDIVFRLWGFEQHEEPKMRNLHVMTLAVASAAFLTMGGGAFAQTVSDGNSSYQQGYADGAAAQKQNNLNAFQNGMQAGQTQPNPATANQAFSNGYQTGAAQANADVQDAYNSGYHDKAVEQNDAQNRSFDNGFRAGATEQSRLDDDFP